MADRTDDLPNLRHLRLFEAAVRLGSLTMASDAVHVSQPAASQAVARLEKLFNQRLLNRSPGRIEPTAAGLIVTNRSLRAMAHLAEAARRVVARGRGQSGGSLERHATVAQLRALSTYAETGSFSAAARRLGQTEPAVQRAAREIEHILGLPLFEGVQYNLRLTQAGETVAQFSALALKEIALAHEELREMAGVFDGRIVVGTLPLSRTRLVPEAVVQVIQSFPDAKIEILDGTYGSLVRGLRTGACDVIVGALRGDLCGAGLTEQALFEDRLAIVARAGHPLSAGTISAVDLQQFPWVLPRKDSPARAVFERVVGVEPTRGYIETGSLVALRGVLLASDAVSIISPRQVDYELRQGLLTTIDLPLEDATRTIGTTCLVGAQPTALLTRFLTALNQVGG